MCLGSGGIGIHSDGLTHMEQLRITLIGFQGECPFKQANTLFISSFLMRILQFDSKKQTRHTKVTLLKHSATPTSSSEGMSDMLTNSSPFGWYILRLVDFVIFAIFCGIVLVTGTLAGAILDAMAIEPGLIGRGVPKLGGGVLTDTVKGKNSLY